MRDPLCVLLQITRCSRALLYRVQPTELDRKLVSLPLALQYADYISFPRQFTQISYYLDKVEIYMLKNISNYMQTA